MNNREYAKKSEAFQERCEAANCRPTTRQMSKYLNGKGIALNVHLKRAHPLELGMGGYYKPAEVEI